MDRLTLLGRGNPLMPSTKPPAQMGAEERLPMRSEFSLGKALFEITISSMGRAAAALTAREAAHTRVRTLSMIVR
jgi:hypothetical protein